MPRNTLFSAALTVFFMTAGAVCAFSEETLDQILVVVNDEIITEKDLRTATEPVIAQYRATLSGHEFQEKVAETRERYLEEMVNERLIKSAAKRESIEVEEKEVDEMMQDVRKKFPSDQVFERVLGEQGLSFSKLKDRFRDQILARRVVDIKVRSQITISPGEIRDYFNQRQGEFKAPRKAQVRQILVRAGENRSDEEARELAASIIQELDKGEDMATMAKAHSEASEAEEGGDMGWVEEGQMIQNIDQQIFRLLPGQHSQPVRSQLGYHIFKVEELRDAETRSFEQVRNRIQSILYRKKTSDQLQIWLKELRENAYISYQS